MESLEAIEAKFNELCDDLAWYIENDYLPRVTEANQSPDATIVAELTNEYNIIYSETKRLRQFTSSLVNVHHFEAHYQLFSETSETRCSTLQFQLEEALHHFTLSPEQFNNLCKIEPSIGAWKDHLIRTERTAAEYVSPADQRAAENPRNLDYKHLHLQSQTQEEYTSNPQKQAEAIATALDAKIYQDWKEAEAKGTTPLAAYEAKQGLPAGYISSLIADLNTVDMESGQRAHRITDIPTLDDRLPQFSWDEAVSIMLEAFSRLDPELATMARDAIADGWVDAVASSTKIPGGFTKLNAAVREHPTNHPYAIFHFNSDWHSVRTLTHEMGHVLARYLEGEAPEPNHPLTAKSQALQETFAHLMENIAEEIAIGRAKTPEEKLALCEEILLTRPIDLNYYGTIPTEIALYERVGSAREIPVSLADMLDTIREHVHVKEGATDAEVLAQGLGNHHIMLNYHPFYLTNYTLAQQGARALMERFDGLGAAEQKVFAENWKNAMRNFSGTTYAEALASVGVDVSDPQTLVNAAKNHLNQRAEDVENLQIAIAQKPAPRPSWRTRITERRREQQQENGNSPER